MNAFRVAPSSRAASNATDCWSLLPPSPFALIACPAMLFFLVAFYLLHALFVLLLSRSGAQIALHTQKVCPELLQLMQQTCAIALLLMGVHLARMGPNWMQATMARQQSAASSSLLPSSSASALSKPKRSCTRCFQLLLLACSELVLNLSWTALLAFQLVVNWHAYLLADHQLDVLRATQLASEPGAQLTAETSLLALSSGQQAQAQGGVVGTMCGSAGSMHLIRWSLLAVIVTSAVAICLLAVVAQEVSTSVWRAFQRWRAGGGGGGKGKRHGVLESICRCCRRKGPAKDIQDSSPLMISTRATASPTKQWIDLQTDEIGATAEEGADEHA